MKMKIISRLLIIVLIVMIVKSEKLESNSQGVFYNQNQGDNNQYVMPKMRRSGNDDNDNYVQVVSHQSYNQRSVPSVTVQPRMVPVFNSAHQFQMNQQIVNPFDCPCAGQVRCKPCAVLAEQVTDANVLPYITPLECPCAPKLNCPVCPPLSLLHEIASKKAVQDQQLAVNLKNLSGRMAKFFDMVIKYAGDVVKYEKDAKDAAKQMEDASLKAQLSRKNMFTTSEKARFIAKAGIVENRPCAGIACNMNPSANPPGMFGYYPEKVFPEEVDNIKEFMDGAFTTNVNGFVDENGNNINNNRNNNNGNMSSYEKDTTGMITVRPVEADEINNNNQRHNNRRNNGNRFNSQQMNNNQNYNNNNQNNNNIQNNGNMNNNQQRQMNNNNGHNLRTLRRR